MQKQVFATFPELVDRVEGRALQSRLPFSRRAMSLENAVKEKDLFFRLNGSVGDFAVLLGTALPARLAAIMNHCHQSYLFCKLRGTLHLLQSEHAIELLLSSWTLLIGLT